MNSDELASNSDDEKKIKKAREAASRKRKAKYEFKCFDEKRQRSGLVGGHDNQLFRGRSFLNFTGILCDFSVTLQEYPS